MKNILYLTLLEVGEPLHSERERLKTTLIDLYETDRIFHSRRKEISRSLFYLYPQCSQAPPSSKGGFLHQKKYEMFAGETGRRLGHRAPWTWRDGESL